MGMTLFEDVGLPHDIEYLTCMEELKLLLLNKKCSMIYLLKHFVHTIESIKTLLRNVRQQITLVITTRQ